MKFDQVREEIPALQESLYLNTGTFGPMPRVVVEELTRIYRFILSKGPFHPAVKDELTKGYLKARERVARLIGADPQEVAFTRNVSEGINLVAGGFDWKPGDEVIITDQEHESGLLPWLHLARTRGLQVKVLTLTNSHSQILSKLADLLTSRTRLLALSHVTCSTGLRLPVEEICRIAHKKGIPVLLDGAQAVGQFPVNVKEIGCDFYAACGHKWLLGPLGVGMLYIHPAYLSQLQISQIGWGSCSTFDWETYTYTLKTSAERYEYGTRAVPLYMALEKGIEFLSAWDLQEIASRVAHLVSYTKDRLLQIPEVRLYSPLDPTLSTGLITFSLDILPGEELLTLLWSRWKILSRLVKKPDGVRISIAFFTQEAEIEVFLQGIEKIVAERRKTHGL
ncbi:MAG TPA: aminotransferase class V-fold PLP-dependent enzyme [Candidatus Limnocylindrales bacterium]|nr:aminotransferase class V-fold PLP-dependent enzyme [Candidatus Limnocylindrales bacterium]